MSNRSIRCKKCAQNRFFLGRQGLCSLCMSHYDRLHCHQCKQQLYRCWLGKYNPSQLPGSGKRTCDRCWWTNNAKFKVEGVSNHPIHERSWTFGDIITIRRIVPLDSSASNLRCHHIYAMYNGRNPTLGYPYGSPRPIKTLEEVWDMISYLRYNPKQIRMAIPKHLQRGTLEKGIGGADGNGMVATIKYAGEYYHITACFS